MDKKRVTFYVDGFNFYYGLKRKNKWIGVGNLSIRTIPDVNAMSFPTAWQNEPLWK